MSVSNPYKPPIEQPSAPDRVPAEETSPLSEVLKTVAILLILVGPVVVFFGLWNAWGS